MEELIIVFTVLITLGAYLLTRYLHFKYKHPLINIIFFPPIPKLRTGVFFADFFPEFDFLWYDN